MSDSIDLHVGATLSSLLRNSADLSADERKESGSAVSGINRLPPRGSTSQCCVEMRSKNPFQQTVRPCGDDGRASPVFARTAGPAVQLARRVLADVGILDPVSQAANA
jgi:hypothetical protein